MAETVALKAPCDIGPYVTCGGRIPYYTSLRCIASPGSRGAWGSGRRPAGGVEARGPGGTYRRIYLHFVPDNAARDPPSPPRRRVRRGRFGDEVYYANSPITEGKETVRIEVHPKVRFGKPVVAGTRIAVEDVLELVAGGVSVERIVTEFYPDLTEEDVRACIRYASARPQEAE